MSKFNNTPKNKQKKTKTVDGVEAYAKSGHQELCDRVLTCFYGESKAYESGKSATNEINKLITKVGKHDPVFLAKLAVLAREEFNLRSISHAITAELSLIVPGKNMENAEHTSVVRKVASRVATRADDPIEIVSYLINNYSETKPSSHGDRHVKKIIPRQLRLGLGDALCKFDEYQLSKYKSTNKELKLRDVFKLVHPKPISEEQSELWGRLMSDTLKQAETWENKISKAGQIDKKGKSVDEIKTEVDNAKKKNWENLILDKKLNYMALMRNLRNIIESGISNEAHDAAIRHLTNENAVVNSKQFPFRFYSAFKALNGMEKHGASMSVDPFSSKYGKGTSKNIKDRYIAALNKALWHSGKNVSKMSGRTLIAVDLSGSMHSSLSSDSTIMYVEVGAVMAALAQQYCEQSIIYGFASDIKLIEIDEREQNPLDNVRKILNTSIGYSTDFHKVLQEITNKKIHVDQVLLFTDCVLNGSYSYSRSSLDSDLNTYANVVNKDVKVYEFNLAAQSSATQLNPRNKNYYHLSGWSDNLLRSVVEMENMKNGIIDMVNNVKL